ncbi:MAG TPA: hypothetical protein VHX90_01210 [Verrucomicrobiae bacterium]|jgi:hypothetical protein|nr:hypothetical protein [Verrucomicrobiae bacterium]
MKAETKLEMWIRLQKEAVESNEAMRYTQLVEETLPQILNALREQRERAAHIAGYALSIRVDRRKVLDDTIVCLQTEDWCRGLKDIANNVMKNLND